MFFSFFWHVGNANKKHMATTAITKSFTEMDHTQRPNWYEIWEFCSLAALLTIRGPWSILQWGKRASVSPLKTTPVSRVSANTDLLWGGRKWTFPPTSTAHHGTQCRVMQCGHSWRRPAHPSLSPEPSCHSSALYDPAEAVRPWQSLAKGSCHLWAVWEFCSRNYFPVTLGAEEALKEFPSAQCLGTLESPPHLEVEQKYFWLKYGEGLSEM